MTEFFDRADYEKLKARMVEDLRQEERCGDTWVCPGCLSSVPASALKCGCGYAPSRLLFPYFSGEITSAELYKKVRNEFHGGDRGTAVFLSIYLTKRFPAAEESRRVREYDPHPGEDGDVSPGKGRKTANRTAAAVMAALLCVTALIIAASLFPSGSPVSSPPQKKEQAKNPPAVVPPGVQVAGTAAAEKAGDEEADLPLSALEKRGFARGREIARVFLTNKQSAVVEKCRESMLKARTQDLEYLVGCVHGYGLAGLISPGTVEIAGDNFSAPQNLPSP